MKRVQPTPGGSAAKKARAGASTATRPEPSLWVEIARRPQKIVSVPQTHYILTGDELLEADDLIIPGESAQDSNDENEVDNVPVRLLDDFSIFNRVTKEFVPAMDLLTEEVSDDWVGTGFVRPYYDGASPSDGVGEQATPSLVHLSLVLECNVHWISKEGQSYGLDQKIYLLTQHGWYILQSPAPPYAPHYRSLQMHHQLFHNFLSTLLETPDMSVDGLLEQLFAQHRDQCPPLFHTFSREDLTSTSSESSFSHLLVEYLCIVLANWSEENAGLVQQLVQSPVIQELYPSLLAAFHTGEPGTVMTPRVGAIAQRLFSQPLHVVAMSEDGKGAAHPEVFLWPVHKEDPKVIEWGEKSLDSQVYKSVVLDGTTYSAGDVVIVNPGEDTHHSRAKHAATTSTWCKNGLATQKWFCKINYFFERPDSQNRLQKYFHAQWLQHGSQTFLQEAAHSQALFWLNECDNLPVECVYSHCNLEPWPLGEAEPLHEAVSDNHFFTGLTYNDDDHSFIHLAPKQALSFCDELRPCVVCGLSTLKAQEKFCISLPGGGVAYKGIDYHVNDFVYHHNYSTSSSLLHIGQVVRIIFGQPGKDPQLRVCQYGRYDDVVKKYKQAFIPLDNRRLFQTKVHTLVEMKDIEGKAFVACPSSSWDREKWVKADDHFYCDLFAKTLTSQAVEVLKPSNLMQCKECYAKALDALVEEELLMKKFSKLRGLELFAGAGGLSTGLDLSGFVQTKWAVELQSSAATSFQANHPDTVVYNQDSCTLLQHAIDTAEGRNPNPLLSQLGIVLPSMPQRGEVDFIYGGPPCQSFSRMNHSRRIDDIRSTMVCNMVSYVEFYRPMYFLLENVDGILQAATDGPARHDSTSDKITMGVVKFIVRSLTALGYQIHFKLLQAGQYGAPQGRQRVIFLGARCDMPLPHFPVPQHHYPKPVHQYNLPDKGVLCPLTRPTGCSHECDVPCVPLPTVTVNEAIGDLPSFDWENPHILITKIKRDTQQAKARLAQGIVCMDAISGPGKSFTGFEQPVPYPHPPLSRYQSWIRGGSDLVTYHYSKRFTAGVVERVISVPMLPNANHADLPDVLQNPRWILSTGKEDSRYRTCYGRIPQDGCFMTALTTLNPNQKGGKVLHPTQHRIITVREAARAQGFPDSYQFLSVEDKSGKHLQHQTKQIGNAVPVPLAAALGREIGKSLLKVYKQRVHQDNVAREQSPEAE